MSTVPPSATPSPTPRTDKLEFICGIGAHMGAPVVLASEYAKLERELQLQDDANDILTRDLELCRAVTRLCCKKETPVSETPQKWDGIERRDPIRNLRSEEE